jgi:hypothetical protein
MPFEGGNRPKEENVKDRRTKREYRTPYIRKMEAGKRENLKENYAKVGGINFPKG